MFGNNRLNGDTGHRNGHHHHVFVPVTDELIFDTPELIEGPLVPYSSGMACHGWLEIELNPTDESTAAANQDRSGRRARNRVSNNTAGAGAKPRRHLQLVFGG